MGRRPGIDGKELILSAALRLFAKDGVEAVSIRAINREAGLGPAAVHYHFGTKDALVEAVLEEYGEVVASTTKRRAKEILAGDEPVTAQDLVAMMAAPYLELMQARPQQGLAWVRVMASLLQSEPRRLIDRSLARLTWRAASRVYPDASPQAVERTMMLCLRLLVTQLALDREDKSSAHHLPLLLDFLSAGLDATLTSEPAAERVSLTP